MKKDIHPTTYRPVAFVDTNNNSTFITRSTVATEETITIDGEEYPLVKVHISSSSHPFFTGEERIVDVEGRVDKFKARREAAAKAAETRKNSKPKAPKKMRLDETVKVGARTSPKNVSKKLAKPAVLTAADKAAPQPDNSAQA